ncbi:MAG: hypothetical protein ABI461_02225 [Polyangiaceae bacterium]
MIDSATGKIIFDDGAAIDPQITRAAFLTSVLGLNRVVSTSPAPNPWSNISIASRAMDGLALLFGARLYFNGEQLAFLNLWQIDPGKPKSWDDWSLDAEIAEQKRNEAWLASFLGPPHETFPRGEFPDGTTYKFAWGEISSSYDPRSAQTLLTVSYHPPEVAAR